MYLIEKNGELSTLMLGKILNQFNTKDRPVLQRYLDYYEGKQDITKRIATDTGKPCNKVVCNYCQSIVNNYLGYITGKPINYENDDFDDVTTVLHYNDVINEDTEYLRQALIYGRAFEINYLDGAGKQRFKVLDSRECIPVYDNTLNNDLAYVIRFYSEDLVDHTQESYIVEVYGEKQVWKYRSNNGFSSFSLLDLRPHFFEQCPVTVFSLNKDETSIFKQVMSLQDAYNKLLSDEVDDFESFCDSYLVLKGCTADEDDLEQMKTHRVLMLDPDSDASYLTKSISDTQIQNMLTNINSHIHKISNSPDLNDPEFAAQTGIALKLRLIGFENTSSAIETQMRKALTKRIELISEILKLTDTERIWRDVNIVFTRNLPTEVNESADLVNSLRGIVSQKTLLTLLPFVTDVEGELKALEEEKQHNAEVYGFKEVDDDDETDNT